MKQVFRNNASVSLLIILLPCIWSIENNACDEFGTENSTRPEVTILQGSVRGVIMKTKNNRTIAGFIGIPFAQPPLGDLRFRAPVPVHYWNGTLDAGNDTADCPQMSLTDGTLSGNEDCLYTNVYTPSIPNNEYSKLLPVLVYIHGGGNIIGGNNSTLYGPGYLLDKDMVLVVPSYRLGALGFLSTGDEASVGNWGLKDLVLALEWVHNNVEFFGGDPNQVTIAGNSAGSIALNYLTLSNLTTGLIHKYIGQSSSGLSTLGYQTNATAIDFAFRLGKYLDCPNDTSTLLVECLRSSNVKDMLETLPLFFEWEVYPRVIWAPIVELNLVGAVLPDTPANLIASGKIDHLPNMMGTLPGDGIVLTGYFHTNPDKFESFLTDFDNVLPYVLNYYNKVKNVTAYTSALKSYYFNNDLTGNRTTLLSNLTQLCTDFIGILPNEKELRKIAATSKSYLYSFNYRGTYSYSDTWAPGAIEHLGSSHSDELIYIFPEDTEFPDINKTMSKTDYQMVDTTVELWTSFIINGIPKTNATHEPWPPYYRNSKYLRIGNEADISVEVKDSDFKDRIEFLRKLDAKFLKNAP